MIFNIPVFFKCRTCVMCVPAQSVCAKFKIRIDPDKSFCSWHKNDLGSKCVFCDNTDNLIVEDYNGISYSFCADHYNAFHSCQGCTENEACEFKKDTNEPQIVSQTIRKGFMTMQTQVKNPNLIAKHCTTCKCHCGTDTCIKETDVQSCDNWNPRLELL